MIVDTVRRGWASAAPPGDIITPTPDYCWGQFAVNGRDNRNTNGPALALSGGTLVGENLHGVVSSSGSVGVGADRLWIYVRLHLPNEIIYNGSDSHYAGFFCRRVAGNTASLDCYISHFRTQNYWTVYKRMWDRKSFVTSAVQTQLSVLAPGEPGYQDFVAIHEFDATSESAKTWISADGASWNEIVNETVAGITAFSGAYSLCFNGYLTEVASTDPPDSQLVECCVREGGGYSDLENLHILQKGMASAFGL